MAGDSSDRLSSVSESPGVENPGAVVCYGVPTSTVQDWLAEWEERGIATHVARSFADCRVLASSGVPVTLIIGSTPAVDPRLLNQSDESLFRAVVLVHTQDRSTADYWRNLAWDALPHDAEHGVVAQTIEAALAESRRRCLEWDEVEDYRRRYGNLNHDERIVLESVCRGLLNKQIANELGVSIRTVEQRRRRVFEKMDVESAVPLAGKVAKAATLEQRRYREDPPAEVSTPNLVLRPTGTHRTPLSGN